MHVIFEGIEPCKYDKNGPLWSRKDIDNKVIKHVLANDYFTAKGKSMSDDVTKATELVEDATKRFSLALDKFSKTHEAFSESAKKASSTVRVAADSMAAGLLKVERTANFDRLERLVGLLERAAVAMNTLTEMEKSGQLQKISAAIK